MERIEQQVVSLVRGDKAVEGSVECDFSIAHQNEIAVSKGVTPTVSSDFKPVLQQSVTYIVCAILINEADEVLMMQEAKSSCAGQWYLPAGRMEAGETIEEAAKREVLEETGLEIELSTLLIVESAQGSWIRFVLTGNATGGKLKTPADADAESLQAKWVKSLNSLSLRSQDILPLVDRVRQHKWRGNETWHSPMLPINYSHCRQFLRIVVVIRKRSNNCVHVLVSEKEVPHLPICEINPSHSIYTTLKRFMQKIFPVDLPQHKPHGLLSVEHYGRPARENDGLCLNLLISMRNALEEVSLQDGFTWLEMGYEVGDALLEKLGKNMTVMFNVIR